MISNEIRATVVDHVLNHGLSMREAGQRVQPNLSRFTVAAIIRTFRMENRYELYLPCVLKYCISIEYSVLTVFVFCRTEREPRPCHIQKHPDRYPLYTVPCSPQECHADETSVQGPIRPEHCQKY